MTIYDLGNALNFASFYMVAGTGAAISMKAGEFNLGGEGQVYAGGFITAVLLAKLASLPAAFAVPLALAAGAASSAVLCFFSALLRKYKDASFLLTSFIISSAVLPLINGLVSGPARADTQNLLATPFINKTFRLTRILPPSQLNISFIFGIILCVLGFLFLYRTKTGRETCIFGISREFALYSGFSEKTITFTASLLSGALHGLCGGFIVTGTYYTCHQGFYLGIGWTALTAAMFAKANPLFVIPSSLLLGCLTAFINSFTLHNSVDFDLGAIIQAVIMFTVSIPFIRYTRGKNERS